jgi:hypothetical protein
MPDAGGLAGTVGLTAGWSGTGSGTGASDRTIAASNRALASTLRRSMLSAVGLPTNNVVASEASRSMLYGWQTQHGWMRWAKAAVFEEKTLLAAWL